MVMQYLQRLGKALMLPVATLPLCGLLMGIGYLLCPASMQGGDVTGALPTVGLFLVKAGSALIDHIALLFAIGVGVGMSEGGDGTGGLAALVSWLTITCLLNVDLVSTLIPAIADDPIKLLAFSKVENPFIGILCGIIGSTAFNRLKDRVLPKWLAFFSGRRSVAISAGLGSIVVAAVLLVAWPTLFGALVTLGELIAGMGAVGAGIYAFLNRLLIPTGLHHALNNVFWFDTIGLGDLTHYWAGDTSADVTWSLGMYMSGFFPCMMFGVPGAALAMVHTAKNPARRRAAAGILASAALCSIVCGVTEPFEFAFMFVAPTLYFVYALLYGIFTTIVTLVGFRAGFAFSAGATDLFFSSFMPAAANTWLIVPLGLAAFASFYLVFRLMITRCDLKTPGREDEGGWEVPLAHLGHIASGADGRHRAMAQAILYAIGGDHNIISVDSCITRLRLELHDPTLVDDDACKAAGARGVMHVGTHNVQVVIGVEADLVAGEFKRLISLEG